MAGLVPFNRRRPMFPFTNNRFDDFLHVMDDFFNDASPFHRTLATQNFKVDVRETENQYCVEAELPGVKKEEIRLDLEDGRLTIAVEHEETNEETKGDYIHRERRFGTMQRSLILEDAVQEGIKATFKDGVLEITVPRSEQAKKKTRIDID
ncbi:MAG: Hsp20/alpha crystallin family protein [Clostridia bacterium]|nr:Hsp20/alpha crystallin family protein [Clostridia bacterium]